MAPAGCAVAAAGRGCPRHRDARVLVTTKGEPSGIKPKLAALDAQADALRSMLNAGTISPTVAQAGLDTIDRERAELLSRAARRQCKTGRISFGRSRRMHSSIALPCEASVQRL